VGPNSLRTGKLTGNFAKSGLTATRFVAPGAATQALGAEFPANRTGNFPTPNREFPCPEQGIFRAKQELRDDQVSANQ
jgi:hypothetical protein